MDVDDDAAERVLVVAVGDGGALRDGDVAEEGVLGELAAALGQHLGRVVHKFHFLGTKFLSVADFSVASVSKNTIMTTESVVNIVFF